MASPTTCFPNHMNTSRALSALCACLCFVNSSAADLRLDGRWNIETTCGVNRSNGRPGFTSRSEWSLLSGQTTFIQKGGSALGKEETTWNIGINNNQVHVSGVGRRDNGDSWEWKLNSTKIQGEKIELNGSMLSNSKQIRDCKIEMSRVNVAISGLQTQVAANSAAAIPASSVAPVAPVAPVASISPTVEYQRPSASNGAQTTTQSVNTPNTIENIVESMANNPLLDIVVLASAKKRDVIQRSIDGNWRIAGDRVCVGILPLVQTDGRAIPLKFFKEITTTRKDIPTELRPRMLYQMLSHTPAKDESSPKSTRSGVSGPTPVTSTGTPSKPKPGSGPSRDELINSAIADGIEAELARKFGKKITAYYNWTGGKCNDGAYTDAHAVPRAYVDSITGASLSSRWRSGVNDGSLHELVAVPVALFRSTIAANIAIKEKNKQEAEAFIRNMAQTPEKGENAVFSAINIGRGTIHACSVLPSDDSAQRFSVPIETLMQTEQFKTFLSGRPSSHTKFNSIDELYGDLQLPIVNCTVVLGNGPTIAKLKAAIDRDGRFVARLMPQLVTERQLIDTHARGLGFESSDMYLFALSVGIQNAQDASQLNTFGIQTKQQYQAALKRLNEAGLGDSQTPDGLIAFLQDEKEAGLKRTTIKKLRAERAATAQAEMRRQSQAQAAAEKKKAVDFPYVAYISCMVGTQKTRIQACMSSRGLQTEIELKNGSEYRMYKMFEVENIGSWNGEELVVDLRSNFELKAQNADDTLTLNIVIKNRSTNAIVFQKSAAKFGVIGIKN